MPNEKEETLEESEIKEEKEESPRKQEKKKIEKLKERIDELEKEVYKWKNDYYRAYADTTNLRNSLEKDKREALKYRSEGFIEELLPILDSFHMALANEPDDEKLKNYLIGFNFVYRNLVTVLENEGVKEIAPKVGDKFDASNMNAVDTVEDEGEPNIIKKVYGNGYMLIDRLIRPANVSVSIKPKAKEENKEEDKKEESVENKTAA